MLCDFPKIYSGGRLTKPTGSESRGQPRPKTILRSSEGNLPVADS